MAEGTLGGTKIADLPRSSFAYCEPNGGTCHFPIRDANGKPDAAHVRNALARLSQSPFEAKARPKVEAAARELGIGEPAAKAFYEEIKAEPFDTGQLDRWLQGQIPRRILMMPFGGPLPRKGAPLGVDIDGEWFSANTDLYDGRAALMASRKRIVDWHHNKAPSPGFHGATAEAAKMKGSLLGHVVFDELPEDEGIWADWWAKAGERRMRMVAALERHDIKLFGSSKAAYKSVDSETGEILTWPLIAHTISTTPQNTWAVVPPLKAMLSAPDLADVPAEALKALLTGLDADEVELLLSFPGGEGAVKAGRVLSSVNEAALRRAIEELGTVLAKLVAEEAAATE